jgi:hypothetical protein
MFLMLLRFVIEEFAIGGAVRPGGSGSGSVVVGWWSVCWIVAACVILCARNWVCVVWVDPG